MAENSKCVYQKAFQNLDRALHDFIKSKKGERKGKRLGFPRWKKRGRCRDSFRLTGTLRCGRTTVTLPRLGTVRTHESTRKLARKLEGGSARVLSATVSRTAQRWFVSFTVEADRAVPVRHARPGSAVGVDLGVTTLLTAAGNLLKLAASGADRVNACGETVRPGPAGHVPAKQEPGTRQRDQTGTVPRQHGTAA